MTTEIQETTLITPEELVARVTEFSHQQWRLVQMSCTKLDHYQIDYTFDKHYKFANLRVKLPLEGPLSMPSISGVYMCAFTYENEIHDLFGVDFPGLCLDFKGAFYRTEVKKPFSVLSISGGKIEKIEKKD